MNRYVKVPYALIDLKVSAQTKCIYISLMKFRSAEKKEITVTLEKIAEAARLRTGQTGKYLTTLVKCGIIEREQKNFGYGQYGCNTYRIVCNEKKYAIIPWEVAYGAPISSQALIAYCVLKKHTDLNKKDGIVYMSNTELALYLDCSTNHVNKVKIELQNKGFLEFKARSKMITLNV